MTKHLAQVRSLLDAAGIQVRSSKCELFRRSAHYCGLIIDGDSIRLDNSALQSVADCAPPRTKPEVRNFVGLVERFRPYIDGFAFHAAPLHRVMNKNSPGKVDLSDGSDQLAAFLALRDSCTRGPVLALPRPEEPLFVWYDASETTYSAIACQPPRNHTPNWTSSGQLDWIASGMRVCGYFSRNFRDHEINWTMPRKESYAIYYFSIKDKTLSVWLRGTPRGDDPFHHGFSDAGASINLTRGFTLDRTRAAWSQELSALPLMMHHVPGKRNLSDMLTKPPFADPATGTVTGASARLLRSNPLVDHPGWTAVIAEDDKLLKDVLRVQDALSSRHDSGGGDDATSPSIAAASVDLSLLEPGRAYSIISPLLSRDTSLAAEQLKDPETLHLATFITAGRPCAPFTGEEPTQAQSSACRALRSATASLVMLSKDGPLVRITPSSLKSLSDMRTQLYVPTHLRQPLSTLLHTDTCGHAGIERCAMVARQSFFWPHMHDDIAEAVARCPCRRAKHDHRLRARQLETHRVHRPFEAFGLDLLPVAPGISLVLFLDLFSKDIRLSLLRKAPTAADLVRAYLREVYQTSLGFTSLIITDKGSQMSSSLFESFLHELGVSLHIAPAGHQESNGAVERAVETLKEMVRAGELPLTSKPEDTIPYLLSLWRRLPSSTTGYTPYEVVYGFPAPEPIATAILPSASSHSRPLNEHFSTLEDIRRNVELNLAAKAARRNDALPVHTRPPFPAGATVLRRQPDRARDFARGTWYSPHDGPWEVDLETSAAGRIIRHVGEGPRKGELAYATTDQLSPASAGQTSQHLDDGEYAVARIHDARMDPIQQQALYLIEWEGYPSRDRFTWEPRSHLRPQPDRHDPLHPRRPVRQGEPRVLRPRGTDRGRVAGGDLPGPDRPRRAGL